MHRPWWFQPIPKNHNPPRTKKKEKNDIPPNNFPRWFPPSFGAPPPTPFQASAGRLRLCRHLGLRQRLGAVQELGEAGHGLGRSDDESRQSVIVLSL